MTEAINPAVGCYYIPPGPRLPPQPSITAGTKLYCSVTEAHVCRQLAQGCTRQRGGRDSNPRPVDRKSSTLWQYVSCQRRTVTCLATNTDWVWLYGGPAAEMRQCHLNIHFYYYYYNHSENEPHLLTPYRITTLLCTLRKTPGVGFAGISAALRISRSRTSKTHIRRIRST